MVQSIIEGGGENLHQIALYAAAQDGQLFTLFKLLEELPGPLERNKAINRVSQRKVKSF